MKLTIYIDTVFSGHKEVTDPKKIARLVKDHIAHLGKVSIYYDVPYDQLKWWQKWLRVMGSGYKW